MIRALIFIAACFNLTVSASLAQRSDSDFCASPQSDCEDWSKQDCPDTNDCVAECVRELTIFCRMAGPEIFSEFGFPDIVEIEGDAIRVFWEGKRQPQIAMGAWLENDVPMLYLGVTNGFGTYAFGDVVTSEKAPLSADEFAAVMLPVDDGFFDLRSWSQGEPLRQYRSLISSFCIHPPLYVIEAKKEDKATYLVRVCDDRFQEDYVFARRLLALAIEKFPEELAAELDQEFLPYYLEGDDSE